MSNCLVKSLVSVEKLFVFAKNMSKNFGNSQVANFSALADVSMLTNKKYAQTRYGTQTTGTAKAQQSTVSYFESVPPKMHQVRQNQSSLKNYTETEERTLGLRKHNIVTPPKSEWDTRYEHSKSLVQIRYQGKVFTICTVEESEFRSLQRKMAPLLKRFGAGYAHSMHMFKNAGLIDAVLSPRKQVNFADLKDVIEDDAVSAGAKSCDIVNYERGLINFRCDPLEIAEVTDRIQDRGYTVLNNRYGFTAKKQVVLSPEERSAYLRFLKQLFKIPGMLEIVDNVKHPSEDLTEEAELYKLEEEKSDELLCS